MDKDKDLRIKKLITEQIKLTEAEGGIDYSSDTFKSLDETRKGLQDAQSQLVINLPGQYQSLYAAELAAIYEKIDGAINEVISLAKKIHDETGK